MHRDSDGQYMVRNSKILGAFARMQTTNEIESGAPRSFDACHGAFSATWRGGSLATDRDKHAFPVSQPPCLARVAPLASNAFLRNA